MMTVLRPILALLPTLPVALLLTGCGGGAGGSDDLLVSFDTTTIRWEREAGAVPMTVELAETETQRQYGLMDRSSLPADRGMLFAYPAAQDSTQGFWMYRTLIPLDIAFLDAENRVVAILSMAPCESPNPRVCRIYSPGVPFHGAVEANPGWFAAHGVGVGDRMVRPTDVPNRGDGS